MNALRTPMTGVLAVRSAKASSFGLEQTVQYLMMGSMFKNIYRVQDSQIEPRNRYQKISVSRLEYSDRSREDVAAVSRRSCREIYSSARIVIRGRLDLRAESDDNNKAADVNVSSSLTKRETSICMLTIDEGTEHVDPFGEPFRRRYQRLEKGGGRLNRRR